MKASNSTRKKWFKLRVTEEERKKIQSFSKQTSCRNTSSYARNVLLQKPVIVRYRNQSADEILSAMICLKNELNAIGNNYNQAVHKLHMLDKIPEIKIWVIQNEKVKKNFFKYGGRDQDSNDTNI